MITIGSILNDRYRLDRPLGRGGFAAVFLATDLRLRREVAVKVLDPALLADADDTAAFFARFEREAQLVAALDHPHILGVHDYGEADGTAYLVMPFVSGGTLYERLRRDATGRPTARLVPARALRYIEQAAAALDYAHARGLVHRDVKPQNMLLRAEDERLLLADFGIARVLDATGVQSRTAATGTLSYMAPEQLEGRATAATDVYALGCTLYQLLTGQVPFTGSTEQVMFAHLTAPIPTLTAQTPDLPPALQPVIDRALAKRPADRYPTAGHLAAACAEALGERPTAVIVAPPPAAPQAEATRPLIVAEQVSETAATAVLPATPAPEGRGEQATPVPPARGSRRLVLGGAAIVAVLAIALLAGLLLRNRAATEGAGSPLATATSGQAAASTVVTRTAGAATRTLAPTGGAMAAFIGEPETVAWSPKGAVLAVAVPDEYTVALWNTGGTRIATLSGHTDTIRGFAWSADGAQLATASDDGTIRLWSAAGQAVATLPHGGSVYALGWQPGGRALAAVAASNTYLWSADGRPIAIIRDSDTFAWAPDGSLLAAGRGTDVELWSPDGQRRRALGGHADGIDQIVWSRDGGKLAVASGQTLRLWSADGQALGTITDRPENAHHFAWSPDGATLATDGPEGAVHLYSPDGQLRATLTGLTDTVQTIAWSPDGKALLAVSYNGAYLWGPDGRTIAVLGDTSAAVWSTVAPLVATNGCNCAAQLWGGDGTPRGALGERTDSGSYYAFSPDGTILAVGTSDDTIRLFRVP